MNLLLHCSGSTPLDNGFFGPGSGEIFLDEVLCQGTESSLLECMRSNEPPNCDHSEDAGVRCEGRLN